MHCLIIPSGLLKGDEVVGSKFANSLMSSAQRQWVQMGNYLIRLVQRQSKYYKKQKFLTIKKVNWFYLLREFIEHEDSLKRDWN